MTTRPSHRTASVLRRVLVTLAIVVPLATTGPGPASAVPAASAEHLPDPFRGVVPARVVDTRDGPGLGTIDGGQSAIGPLGPAGTLEVEVLGRGGVPADGVGAVAVNVTVVGPTLPSYVTAYPSGSSRPVAANLTMAAGETIGNLVVVGLGENGTFTLFNFSGSTHVVVDVLGWFPEGDDVTTLVPARLRDTRAGAQYPTVDGVGEGGGAAGPASTTVVDVLGRGGVPTDGVGSVILNVSVTEGTDLSFVTVFPTGVTRPNAANPTVHPGRNVSNLTIVPVGADGSVSLYQHAGSAHLVVDVLGWFPDDGGFTGLSPARLLETRTGPGLGTVDGVANGNGALGPNAMALLPVLGRGGVPLDGVGAVVLNVTAVDPTLDTYVTVYPTDAPRPNAASVNPTAPRTLSNTVIVPVAPDGSVSLYQFAGSADLVVDVLGWFPTPDEGFPITLVSAKPDGTAAPPGNSARPDISADGIFVAFQTGSPDLKPGDPTDLDQIVVKDLQTGDSVLASVGSDGTPGNDNSYDPSISADGRVVAFISFADDLVPGDTNFTADVFVRDLHAGTTERVNVTSAGEQAQLTSAEFPAVSGDGRYVVFETAEPFVADDTNGVTDVYRHDRQTGTTIRVSLTNAGAQIDGEASTSPDVSADGRYVVFQTLSPSVVPGDTNGVTDVFRRDVVAGTTVRVSVGAGGIQGDDGSFDAGISDDGTVVAFTTWATQLVPGDVAAFADVLVRDLGAGTTTRVSVTSTGATPSDGASALLALSGDGTTVLFTSQATDVVPGDENGGQDVFVHDRTTGSVRRINLSEDGVEAGTGFADRGVLDQDGSIAVFESTSADLVAADTLGNLDLFAVDLG